MKIQMQIRNFGTIVIVLLVCLTGCRPSISCNQIVDPKLHISLFTLINEDKVKPWIIKEYQVSDELIAVSTTDTQMFAQEHWYEWSKGGANFTMIFIEKRLQRILYDLPKDKRPQLNQLIACFGSPDAYRVDRFLYRPNEISIFADFVYSNKGWVFRATWADTQQIQTTNLIDGIRLVATKPYSQMVAEAYSTTDGRDSRNVKPWPSSIQDLKISEYGAEK